MVQAGGGDGWLPDGTCKLSLESTSQVRLNPLLAYCGGKQRCPVLGNDFAAWNCWLQHDSLPECFNSV